MTDEIMERARRHELAMARFDELLSVLRASGFDLIDSYDLRACMERDWEFARVLEALERHGRRLAFTTPDASVEVEKRYRAAMDVIEPYYGNLVSVLEPAGFDESWGGKSLRGCLKLGYSFERFLGAMDGWERPLRFENTDIEWAVEMSYLAVLTHGQTMVDLYAAELADVNRQPHHPTSQAGYTGEHPPGEERRAGW